MTPTKALSPQPRPIATDRSESVTGHLVLDDLDPVVRALLLERRKQGRKVYDTELVTHNGRDAGCDLLQELVDALVYAQQRALERGESIDHARVHVLTVFVRDLALELGVEP